MSVERFSDISEMGATARVPAGTDGLKLALELSAFCAKLAGLTPVRGVHKYRSIEEASAAAKVQRAPRARR